MIWSVYWLAYQIWPTLGGRFQDNPQVSNLAEIKVMAGEKSSSASSDYSAMKEIASVADAAAPADAPADAPTSKPAAAPTVAPADALADTTPPRYCVPHATLT
jgi:hypothetical protein